MEELDELTRYIKRKRCIPFLGAGVSMVAGCSDWNSIPSKLLALPVIQEALTDNPILLPTSASNEEQIEILTGELERSNNLGSYHQILRSTLLCYPKKVIGDYSLLIKSIKKIYSFSNILVSTNADNCLDLTEYFHPDTCSIYHSPEDFRIVNLTRGGIYHIHGHRDALKDTVFTKKAYNKRYSDIGFENFLCHIFSNYNLLFIGYSFSDEPLLQLIGKMRQNQHFALVRQGKYTREEKTDLLDKYNIKLVEYTDHKLLPSLLEQWVEKNFPTVSLHTPTLEEVTHVS